MSSSLLDQAVRGEAFPEPLTTDQYHRMLESGILIEGAPIELIDGILMRKDRRDTPPQERAEQAANNGQRVWKPLTTHVLQHVVEGCAETEPITVAMYHAMIELGVIAEGTPVELIDGCLLHKDQRDSQEDPMGQGSVHMSVVTELHIELNDLVRPLNCHGRSQGPITLGTDIEPEPDVAIVRGATRDYRDGHPGAQDVLLVVEVSASSLKFDQRTKAEVYASAGISTYWIVNLQERRVEVYTQPDDATAAYSVREDFKPGQTITFDVDGQTLSLDVDAIFPA